MSRYLRVSRLEFVVTHLCNSNCRHCQVGGEERGREFPNHVDKDLAVEIVRKVGERYKPKSIMTFGGEPMLYPEVVYAIHTEATRSGIPAREVITNGLWSSRREKTQQIADNLSRSGVNDVGFSIDCFHQEFIPLKYVREAGQALLNVGVKQIEWSPCWVVSEDDNNEFNVRTKSILRELADLPIKCGEGNVMQPEGRATVNLKEFLPRKSAMPEGKCGEMPYTERLDSVKSISVEPDGRIAVCNQFYIGSACDTDVIELLEQYDPYNIPEAKAIIEDGMKGLLEWAATRGIRPGSQGYYSICDMCTAIRRQTARVNHSS
jgi:sulfatase maturation enzyme AslB (radical SAM superfamily)